MTYFGSKLLANFRPTITARLREKRNRDPRADREGNDEKHLAAIRRCPCCVPKCSKMGNNDPHHLKSTGERGGALRSPDKWAVPMCRFHHEEIERIGSRNELKWFRDKGIDAVELANALWNSRGDAPALVRIVLTHRSAA